MEQHLIERAAKRAFLRLDHLFDGHFAEAFAGLQITIGDNVTKSGGEAFASENRIVFDRKKMLLSLTEAEMILQAVLDSGDWTSVMSAAEAALPASCLEYNLVHEVGHILDGRLGGNEVRHRIAASESPTKYGRHPDRFSDQKDHEAFAEGFTYMAYARPVSKKMRQVVTITITRRLAQLS